MQVDWMVMPSTALHTDGSNEPFTLSTHVAITHKDLKMVYYCVY